MKKGWIITLIVFVVLILVQSSRRALAQYNDTSGCKNDRIRNDGLGKLNSSIAWYNEENINKCISDTNNSTDWCCVCFESEPPSVCTQLYDVLSVTPTPTNTPTSTPTNTPTPTPTPIPIDCKMTAWTECSKTCGGGYTYQYKIHGSGPFYGGKPCDADTLSKKCNEQECSAVGTGGLTKGNASSASNELQMYLITQLLISPTPTITRLPTFTPVPTPLTTTPTTIPIEKNQETNEYPPSITHAPTAVPTVKPTTAPPPAVPTERLIPKNLIAKTETAKNKSMTKIDTTILTEIKIAPSALVPTLTDRPILSEEQTKLALSEAQVTLPSGILVTLEQKTGNSYVTQQDELLVKRGNQFFSISNQAPPATQKQEEQSKSTQSTEVPQLEINANNVIARSSMGLSVDPLSGILTVQTPTGPHKVSIMPDEALGIVIELKALNAKGVQEPSILLVSEKGALIYRISGAKVEKFLGLFPLPIQKQILISVDTGSVVKVELSLLAQILSLFTF